MRLPQVLVRSSEIVMIELSLVHMIQQAVHVARGIPALVTTANPELHRRDSGY